ncbi:hypothetical protein CEXT_631781 [Caerostris extrusa]|uniref:Uncharacterized protein n=1 Tax=Caerostris extrusa TaxID=172846 RepID=A0AAV4W6Z9_CAEEX|nr:hypothetical protein CEXT_631781 [Caerostris extrusa]
MTVKKLIGKPPRQNVVVPPGLAGQMTSYVASETSSREGCCTPKSTSDGKESFRTLKDPLRVGGVSSKSAGYPVMHCAVFVPRDMAIVTSSGQASEGRHGQASEASHDVCREWSCSRRWEMGLGSLTNTMYMDNHFGTCNEVLRTPSDSSEENSWLQESHFISVFKYVMFGVAIVYIAFTAFISRISFIASATDADVITPARTLRKAFTAMHTLEWFFASVSADVFSQVITLSEFSVTIIARIWSLHIMTTFM